jgi:hypothetical protein
MGANPLDGLFGITEVSVGGVPATFRQRVNLLGGWTSAESTDEDGNKRLDLTPPIGGTGDGTVIGPEGAVTAGRIAIFTGGTGEAIADGGTTVATLTAATAAAQAAADNKKLTVVTISTSTVTLDAATHACKYLRFTHASGCVVTFNTSVFAAGDWMIFRATQAAAVSFAGSGTVATPTSKAATSSEAGATLLGVINAAGALELSGALSDA